MSETDEENGSLILKTSTVSKPSKAMLKSRTNGNKTETKENDALFSAPILDDLDTQWTMTFVWFLVGVISVGVVWENKAEIKLKISDCSLESSEQKNAALLMLLIIVHFLVFLFCFYRIKTQHKNDFENILVPFFGFYSCFYGSQMLYKLTILITSGLSIASAIRTYYLLNYADNHVPPLNPVFSETSGLLFMINILLFGFLGIFQMKKDNVDDFYLRMDLDLMFLKSKQAMSQFLYVVTYVVVFVLFLVHSTQYELPFNCVKGSNAGRKTVIVFGIASFSAQLGMILYMYINQRNSYKDFDTIDIVVRNVLGIASHILLFSYFIYIIIYFSAGLANVSNIQ